MNVYLAGPNTQQQAQAVSGMPVLLSFAYYKDWLEQYHPTFRRILIDSGAFSELNSGQKIDLGAYRDWSQRWLGHADAIAGLDSISGDWRLSLANYDVIPWSFPTYHETDPPELLPELVAMARERKTWLGLGLLPPRHGKERWVREACERIPEGVHVHGWALRAYTHVRRLDSVDSSNWFRDAFALRARCGLDFLTYGECLEIVVKRYKRWNRRIRTNDQRDLFGSEDSDISAGMGGEGSGLPSVDSGEHQADGGTDRSADDVLAGVGEGT